MAKKAGPHGPAFDYDPGMSERVIIIHSLEQAVTALKVARELERPVTLASPPGAAAYTTSRNHRAPPPTPAPCGSARW